MKFVYFTHSLVSDWNHGNAHFLRGIVSDLQQRGHQVDVLEPSDGWSRTNLIHDEGEQPLTDFALAYPDLRSSSYQLSTLDLHEVLEGADVVIVHEWNDPALVAAVGKHRADAGAYHLLFHDTHHRAVTAPETMQQYDLDYYDGVLAFGEAITQLYLDHGWADQVWTWHEAADTRLFTPTDSKTRAGDLVWIGNWGDEERSEELRRFLIDPIRRLKLQAEIYGVRFPKAAKAEIAAAEIPYRGWLPNYRVPHVFSQFGCTVHIPRRPYRESLAGIPTIRVFEALACGIPLICLRWDDTEHLFSPGKDYLVVDTPEEMIEAIRAVLSDSGLRERLIRHGRQTILASHTCAHRVDELLNIITELGGPLPVSLASTKIAKS